MTESPHQGEEMDREDYRETAELVDRLARRFTAPIGVIDVRYAEQKCSRIAGWLASRFALLNQLRARYEIDEGISGDRPNMTMQQYPDGQTDFSSTTVQSFYNNVFAAAAEHPGADRGFSSEAPSDLAGDRSRSAAETTHSIESSNESLSGSEPKYRISRRRPPIARASSSESYSQPVGTESVQSSEFRVQGSESDSHKADQPIQRTNDAHRSGDVSPGTPLVLSKQLTKTEGRANQSSESQNDSALPSPEERRHWQLPLASPRDELIDQQVNTSSTSAPMANQSAGQPKPGTDRSLPLARYFTEAKQEDGPTQIGAGSQTESVRAAAEAREIALASEVRNASVILDGSLGRALPDIVWRNNTEPHEMIYTESIERVRNVTNPGRQDDDSAGSSITQKTNREASPGTLTPRDDSRKDEIQIEHLSPGVIRTISERVIRAISQDLKIERERRGISKWR